MKKELLYIFFILLLFFALQGFPTNLELFTADSTLDLNIHDTYLVIPSSYYFISTLLLFFSIIYFTRVLFTKFKNHATNYIYLIANGLLIIVFIYMVFFFRIMITSFDEQNIRQSDSIKTFQYFQYFFIILLILAISLEIFVISKMKNQKTDASTI